MSDSSSTDPIRDLVGQLDARASAYAIYLKKIRDRIARYRKIAGAAPTAKEVAKLIKDIQASVEPPEVPDARGTADALAKQLTDLRRDFEQSFGESLQAACAEAGLPFKSLADGFGLGPFFLAVDAPKEQAAISYAKVVVAKDIPLNAATCVRQAAALKASLLDEPSDLADVRRSTEEAMRVALARKNKAIHGALRVELPQVFRELVVIRHSDFASAPGTPPRYNLPRFVVDLSRLIQSEANLDSKNPLRLETAVLENTKDNRRSIFIPKELGCGFGEGTYYQALTLNTEK